MTLRLKINLIVGGLTLLFFLMAVTLQVRSLRDSVSEEIITAHRVAEQVLNRTVWLYAEEGAPALLSFLQGMGRVRSNEITLFDGQGRELYRSPPSQYKAGRDAPVWFTRLVSARPLAKQIAFPAGRLDLQSNASRAVLDAWDYLKVLVASGLALLILINVLVFALVGRSVRPLGRVVDALNQLQAGHFEIQLPQMAGTEAAAIGSAFNRMVDELHRHIETERRAVRAELQLSDHRALTRWMEQHVERERHMIARELHDELSQSVTAIRSIALSIAQRVKTIDPKAESAARLIVDESSRLYDAMHGVIPRLTPLVLDNFGLVDALNDLIERTRRSQPGLRAELIVDLGDASLGSEASLTLYRAAQEGISNALQHGGARVIHLGVHGSADVIVLSLQDDGCGLAPGWSERKGHYGLLWLTERAEALGGRLYIRPAQPHGVTLRVELPLDAARQASAL